MADPKQLAQEHAAWLVKVAKRLSGVPTWDQVEFLLAEEFEHGYKHGFEDQVQRKDGGA